MMGESAYGLAVAADRADADSMSTVAVIALSEALDIAALLGPSPDNHLIG